jgi:hypothetical protein
VIWWVWLLFAVANLVDLAVQGRDHLSVVAAFILLLITGVMYATALRPRIVAGEELTIANPLREHRVGWAAVAGFDSTDLVRVRCEWPLGSAEDAGTAKRAIYSWALHSSRRRLVTARMRTERSRVRPARAGAFGAPARYPADDQPPTIADTEHAVTALNALAEQAHAATPGQRAHPPLSTWSWQGLAAILIPALALVIAILVLCREFSLAGRRVGRPRAQPVHVVQRRACLDRGVYQDGHVPCGGQSPLVGVEHV